MSEPRMTLDQLQTLAADVLVRLSAPMLIDDLTAAMERGSREDIFFGAMYLYAKDEVDIYLVCYHNGHQCERRSLETGFPKDGTICPVCGLEMNSGNMMYDFAAQKKVSNEYREPANTQTIAAPDTTSAR